MQALFPSANSCFVTETEPDGTKVIGTFLPDLSGFGRFRQAQQSGGGRARCAWAGIEKKEWIELVQCAGLGFEFVPDSRKRTKC